MSCLIAHEWIEQTGGAEQVLDHLAEVLIDAEIVTLWNDAPERYQDHKVSESWMARTPLRRAKAFALPFMSYYWRHVDTRNIDLILASSHAFAHQIGSRRGSREAPTFVYAHTPARYLWTPDLDQRGNGWLQKPLASYLRKQDRKHAGGASYAANSEFVRARVAKAWEVDARVIYPPVQVERIQRGSPWVQSLSENDTRSLENLPPKYLVAASRFVPYKRLDFAIKFAELVGMPIVIAGRGPDEERLRKRAEKAAVPVTFIISPSDSLLYALIESAVAFVFPPVEDFGILPIESVALETPVVCNRIGGAAESMSITSGGAPFDFESADQVTAGEALDAAMSLSMPAAAQRAAIFSGSRFQKEISDWIFDRADY